MEKHSEKQTQAKNLADIAAKKEGKITALSLLQEIEPLLKEYFIGNFEIADNAIIMQFLNGQKFRLQIS